MINNNLKLKFNNFTNFNKQKKIQRLFLRDNFMNKFEKIS
jgi:hypothetical protein